MILIRACEFLDLGIIKAQPNIFDNGPVDDINNAQRNFRLDGRGKDTEFSSQPARLTTSKISLAGMTCAACSTTISNAVSKLSGVERIAVSVPLSRATVVHHPSQTSLQDILSTIEDLGYGATAGERSAQQNLKVLEQREEIERLRSAFTNAAVVASAVSGLETVLWLHLPLVAVRMIRLVGAGLATWTQVSDAGVIHHAAWRRGLRGKLTMDSLVSLSLLLGMVLSVFNVLLFGLEEGKVYWSSLSLLTTVILGGRLLDTVLRKQSTLTFAGLYRLQEKSMFVKLVRSAAREVEGEQVVDAAALVPRDEIKIGSGVIIPCDCYVLRGETWVDQATMTGESRAVLKKPGDSLLAGTTNLSYEIVAVVSKPQEDSALESLIASISTATENSSPSKEVDTLISRFAAGILTLTVVCFLATLNARWSHVSPSLALNFACERAMAILASACPCALGLATPTAVIAGLDAAQQRGVIVKRGFETLQALSRLTHVVLDKTGTLTTGQLSVPDVQGRLDEMQRMLLCIAERDDAANHPVAGAVFRWAFAGLSEEKRRLVHEAKVCKTLNQAGNGVTCSTQLQPADEWQTVYAGNETFLQQNHILMPECTAKASAEPDSTLVHIAINNEYIGSLRLRDTIRPSAPAVISTLKHTHNLSLSMLTGDVSTEANRVAQHLQIPVLSSHALPTEKQTFVRALRARSSHNRVAMLGDGLNDAPALSAADVGIALNSTSARAGVAEATNAQTADVIFTSPELSRLPELLEIAEKTTRQAGWNLWWAVGYNLIAVGLAMGVAEPVVVVDAARAGTMMALSSVSVLGWSLWLRRDLSGISSKGAKRG
ncbi:uncharacterized protein LTR77_009987 [Saxophila tyrrhenica]|uniref:HMA domain-containing protein n=1 Tax=Saxophila tyrrhenica TaxID=1690608 RepID=A0AAV9NWK5_9PEZI|nr:hypothetical protein LTR77_009987 [Saxophila tyrrhenica]